jgi:hypothetical protein
LTQHGYQDDREGEISLDTYFLRTGFASPIELHQFGLPGPTSKVSLDTVVRDCVAAAWAEDTPLVELQTEVTLGSFDETGDSVEVTPQRIYKRRTGSS